MFEYIGNSSSITKLLLHLNGNSTDSSGNGSNGTDTAITYSLANGRFGQGAGFNGTTSKIVVPAAARLYALSAFTAHLWFKTSATAGTLYGEGRTSAATSYINLAMSTLGALVYNTQDDASTTANITSSSSGFNDSKWHLATCVKVSASSRLFYIDGYLQGSSSTSIGTQTLNTSNLGALQRTSTAGFYSGTLDEVIFENYAWGAQNIRKYFALTSGKYSQVI